jgi:hypothetical protein
LEPIIAQRQTTLDVPWSASSQTFGAVLTSDDWSSERRHLVGRTNMLFSVAVRSVEAAQNSVRFRLIGDSPDLRHPVFGSIELTPTADQETLMTVALTANMDEEPHTGHLGLREAIMSLADVLMRTAAATATRVTDSPDADLGHSAP